MKNWKKFLTLSILFVMSIFTCVACGKNGIYDNMTISVEASGLEDNSINLSADESKNTFTLKVAVDGVSSDVDKHVEFVIDNQGIVVLKSAVYYNGVTTATFQVKSDGNTIIHINTVEGNKTLSYPITVNVPIQLLSVKNNLIPLVRGQETSLYINDDYLVYTPSNTTQREVEYYAESIYGENSYDSEDIRLINDYIKTNPNTIKIPEETTIKSFYLTIKSKYNENLYQKTIVNVLDAPDSSLVQIMELNADETYPLLERNEFTGEYSLTLSLNNGDFFEFHQVELALTYENLAFENYKTSYQQFDNQMNIVEVNNPAYSVRIKNLGLDEKFSDTDIITASTLSSSSFEVVRNSKEGEYTLIFVVDYYGYEGRFESIEIPVNVKTIMFPSEIKLFGSRADLMSATKETLGLQDEEIVLYSNGEYTPVYVDVWSDLSSLSRQPLSLSVNNENVDILNSDGMPIDSCVGGEVIYLRKGSLNLVGDVVLTLTSTIFDNVSRSIKLSYINETTSINVNQNKIEIALDPNRYSQNMDDINISVDLILENYLSFTGLPRMEDGTTYDYSSISIEVDSKFATFVYDADTNSLLLNIKNRIGSTKLTIKTANGLEKICDLVVYFPIDDASFFSMQLENFETDPVQSDDFVYKFYGADDKTVVYKTQLLVDETYNFYYLLGTDENAQIYNDLTGVMNVGVPTSSDKSCIEVDGKLIKVKKYSAEPVTLTYSYTTVATFKTIYVTIEVTLERTITSITTSQYNVELYDANTLNRYAVDSETQENYLEKYGTKNISINLNPSYATVDTFITWTAGSMEGGTFVTDYDENKSQYEFTINDIIIRFTVSDDQKSGTLMVSNTLGKEFKFKLYAYVNQQYISAMGEIITSQLNLEIVVNVYKASRVSDISAEIYNQKLYFDIRDMSYNTTTNLYTENNTYEFDYKLIKQTADLGKEIVIDDITIYTPNSDITVEFVDENTLKLTYNKMSGAYLDYPVYKIYLVANDSQKKKIDAQISYNTISNYFTVISEIEVRVANGETVPFEIDSAQELLDIGNTLRYSNALNANYVLTKNIYLTEYNWSPIGVPTIKDGVITGGFNGTLSGRYYLTDDTYRDFGIYNLTINVDNSASDSKEVIDYYGLFAYVGVDAVISNLKIYNYSINIIGYQNTNERTTLSEYIGVIAGYNDGQIIDCEIDDGILSDSLTGAIVNSNKNITKGINYDSNTAGIYSNTYIGGIAGYNSNLIENAKVKTFISFNDNNSSYKRVFCGGVVGLNDGNIISNNTDFVVTSGLEGFDVVSVINAHQDSSKLNDRSFIGGVAGVNSGRNGEGRISGLAVRTFVYGNTNIGGLIGFNNSVVDNNIVIPNLIGINNIGGLIGSSSNGSDAAVDFIGKGLNVVKSNKVQFLDFKDEMSYFNTAIYRYASTNYNEANVGGLIGIYSTTPSIVESSTIIKSISFDSVVLSNSVCSYYTRDISTYSYSNSSKSGFYYGDIVISIGDDTNAESHNISGFIGLAKNAFVSSAYVDANIIFESSPYSFVGGVIGTAKGIVSIFNTSVFGTVYNNNRNYDATNYVGSFIGNANELNVFEDYDIFHIISNEDGVSENYIYFSTTNNEETYKNLNGAYKPYKQINNLDWSDAYNITLNDNISNISYKYANINSSYSLLGLNQTDFNDVNNNDNTTEILTINVANFAAQGESRKITNSNMIAGSNTSALIVINYYDTAYAVSSLQVSNLLALNSFYAGYNDANIGLYIKANGEEKTIDLTISNLFNINNMSLAYLSLENYETTFQGLNSFDYYISLYNLENEYEQDSISVLTKLVYQNKLKIVFDGKTSSGSVNETINMEVAAKFANDDLHVSSSSISNQNGTMKNLYICNNLTDTGINSGDESNLINYYRYFNNQIHSGYPLAFAENRTFSQIKNNTSVNYVNLIINLEPTLIEVGSESTINSKIDYDTVWQGSSEDLNILTPENETIFYYEIDYSKLSYSDQNDNGETIKVIDFNNDGIFTQLDKSYSSYISNMISSKNIYNLSKVIGISVLPPFLQNGMITFSSSDRNIAEIVVVDGEACIKVNGIGSVTFDVYSAYNPDIRAQFTLNIISAVNNFDIYSDMIGSTSVNNTMQIVKNEDLSTSLYAQLTGTFDTLNSQLDNYSNNLKLPLTSSDVYGVRYFFMNGENSIYFTDETTITSIKINGKSFEKLQLSEEYGIDNGKFALYVDSGMEVSFTGLEVAYGIKLLAVPYIIHGDERTYLFDFTSETFDLNNELVKVLELNVIEGTYDISTPTEANFKPINSQDITVTVKTDNENNQLFFNIYDSNNKTVEIYEDSQKITKMTTTNVDSLYGQSVNGVVVAESDDKETTPYILQTFYFEKMYLKLISVDYEYEYELQGEELVPIKLITKKYNFRLGVYSEYLFDDNLISSYTIDFKVLSYLEENGSHKELTSNIKVNIERQLIDDSIVKHYSAVDQYVVNQDKEEYERNDYYESNTLVSGYPGMLQIDLFPKYANVDYIEVVSSSVNGYYVSLEQLVAVNNSTNEYFDGYYRTYTDTREFIEDGRGIRIKKHSYMYTNFGISNYVYDGTFYLRTVVPTIPYGETDFVLTVKCYFENQVIFEDSITINVMRCPTVDLKIDGSDVGGVVALGNSINIDVSSDSEISWSVDESEISFASVANSSLPVYVDENTYSVSIKGISELGDYRNYIGKELKIKATVSVDVKGRIYSSSDYVTIKLALFTIDELTVKNVTNGYFEGVYNQPYDLVININATYDKDWDESNSFIISNIINNLALTLSNKDSKSFYVMNGNIETAIQAKQYDDFLIETSANSDFFSIKNNMRYPTSTLKAKAVFEYTTYNADSSPYGIIINPTYTTSKFVYQKDCSFGLNFVRLSNEEYPEPIYTALEFANMEEGGYYILLDDIVLEDWTPLDTEIASLDGNGYVITIDSFYDTTLEIDESEEENNSNYELQLGIFSTISENTTIKNLIIEVKNNERLLGDNISSNVIDGEVVGDLDIDVANYSKVEFGLLAGVNSGIVTNVTITNNANSYRNERNELLYSRGLINSYQELSEINSSYTYDDSNQKTYVERQLSIINLNYGKITSTSTENRIGGLVGVNNGYITNSNINNITIKGLDYVAGFVAENTNIISSSYFAGGTINAQVSAENTETLGASAFVFTNSGKIMYSYAAGANYSTNNTGLNDLSSFVGESYKNTIQLRNRGTAVVSESGNSSGFVYNNTGSIDDCYSNILVYGNKSVGFVYQNSGSVNNVYTLSSVLQSDTNNNPFISVIDNNTKANNTGSITNAYYLKVINSDTNKLSGSSDPIDKYLNESLQVAVAISANKLATYSTFESFAFNSNLDSTQDINYTDSTMTAIEDIVRSVWFYPNSITTGSSYFRNSDYTYGAPQLVSANLNTYSLKYYVSDNSSKINESIYSGLLENHSVIMLDVTRNSIVPSIMELSSTSLISRLGDSDTTPLTTMQGYSELVSSTDISTKYENLTQAEFEVSTIQYIKVDLYLKEETLNKITNVDEIKNSIIKYVLESNVFSGYCYVQVNLISTSDQDIPESTSSYEYYSILENTNGISIEYGNSILNPYIVKTATNYNEFVMQTDDNKINNTEKTFKSDKYLRLVKDISFNSSDLTAITFNVNFSGVLDGNGMTISNLRINADTTISSNAVTKQQSDDYEENEYSSSDKKVTSVGMFAKLTNGAVVKNLNVEIAELFGTGVNYVGTIAGQVIDSNIYNINVSAISQDVEISGYNAVGGIAGKVTGKSSLVNLNNSVSVVANYVKYNNTYSKDYINGNIGTYNVYNISDKTDDNKYSSNINVVSFAGGIAGILDLDKDDSMSDSDIDMSAMGKVRQTSMTGNLTIIGEIVGGLYGYIGRNSIVTTSNVLVDSSTTLDASRIAGGLAGINLGTISRSYVSNIKSTQDTIDNNISSISTTVNQIYGDNLDTGSDTFFSGNAHFIGGLIGLNQEGRIENSYNKVNVVNIDSMYAGGLIGANIGGEINSAYTTADVYAFKAIGGIIGLNTKYEDSDNSLYIDSSSYTDFVGQGTSDPTLNMSGIVAINMWELQHLNNRRYHINSDASNCYIGTLIGYNDSSNIAVDSIADRQLEENMYTITTYTYDSIIAYNESSSKDSFISFKLLSEIGNETYTLSLNNLEINSNEDPNGDSDSDADDNMYIYRLQFSDADLYSGFVVDTTASREFNNSGHFSRLRYFSSVRTIKEILSRVYIKDEAVNMLTRMSDTDNDGIRDVNSDIISNLEKNDYSFTPSGASATLTGTAFLQAIYPSTNWNTAIWSGVGINSYNEKVDDYILPLHETKVNDPIIYVYTYEDLKKVNEYPNGTFIIKSENIIVPSGAQPLASLGNPFTGTLRSGLEDSDGNVIPANIIFENEFKSTSAVGLFAAVKGAYFSNITIQVKNNIVITNSGNNASAGGALFGYGYAKGYTPITLKNVTVTYSDGAKITTDSSNSFSASYMGGIGGYAESIYLNNVEVNSPNIYLSGETNNSLNKNMYIGGMFGYGAVSSLVESTNITINNPIVNIDITFEGGNYDTLAIGGAFGKLINTSANADGVYKLSNMTISNATITGIISAKDNEFVSFDTVAISGGLGMLEGLQLSKKFTLDKISLNNGSVSIENNGIYSSSVYSNKGNFSIGGFIGQTGGSSNGYISLSNITNKLEKVSYTHNNESQYLKNTNFNSDVNISSLIGSVITCNGELNSLSTSTLLEWELVEKDSVNINVGNIIGKMASGNASLLVNTQNIQTKENSTITLGETTKLNVGGLIGKMSGGNISKSANVANIVLYLSDDSYSSMNVGGLVGYADVDSSDYSISESYATGIINIITSKDSQSDANIGGLVGYVHNNLKMQDCYSSNDIETYIGNTNTSSYNAVGGIIGTLEVDSINSINFDLNRIYTIANIILNNSSNENSCVAGIIAKAISSSNSSTYDISTSLNFDSVYYLADFMLDTNSIGIGLSVEEMLYNNYGSNAIFVGRDLDSIWTFEENKYPRLNWVSGEIVDERISPTVVSELETLENARAFIITDTEINLSDISVSGKDIYFKNTLNDDSTLFNSVDKRSRIYGIVMNSASQAVIQENSGKIAGTVIKNLSSDNGYIVINNGLDINPVINITSGYLYNSHNGLLIYANITMSTETLIGESSTGEIKLGKFVSSSAPASINFNVSKVIDSYITNNTNYIYFNHLGIASDTLTEEQSQDVLNFSSDYDFYNDWIILSINQADSYEGEEKEEYLNDRRNGRVFLRWELKEVIGEKWHFEDIDLYSTTQTAYKDFVWNNYVNYIEESIIDTSLSVEEISTYKNLKSNAYTLTTNNSIITINNGLGLAYFASLVNKGELLTSEVYLSQDIDLLDKLFTPISGGLILEYAGNNIFTGYFEGNNHVIKNMYILNNNNSGLFGSSQTKKYSNVTIENALVLTTKGNIGTLVAEQQGNSTIENIEVSNSTIIHTLQSEDTTIVGGLVGLIITSEVQINNSSLSENVNVYNGNYVGGLVGEVRRGTLNIEQCYNKYKVTGVQYVGGLVGYSYESQTKIIQSYNEGDVIATGENSVAGGLIGYASGSTQIEQCYNSSYVKGTTSAGLIGLSQNSLKFKDCYVSRGDVGAMINNEVNYRNEDYSDTNMNENTIIGQTASAFVNTSSSVAFDQCYSSLKDLLFTNSSSATYTNSYLFTTEAESDKNSTPYLITHSDLSMPNNNIFDNWSYIWSRVSQKNNNYPVLLFINGSWVGVEPENIDGETYYINTAEELAWVADQVNTGATTFANSTIILNADIDLQKKLWNPIGYDETHSFQGTFNFNGKTITNLTTNGYYVNNIYNEANLKKDYVGFFGYTKNATLKGDLTLKKDDSTPDEGAHVQGLGSYVGALIGYAKDTTIDENATIISELNVQGVGNYIGGLIGGLEINGSVVTTISLRTINSSLYTASDSSYSLGSLINYGYTSGKSSDSTALSKYVGGIIGGILTNNSAISSGSKSVVISAKDLKNYGEVRNCYGNSGGIFAEINGQGFTFEADNVLSASNISNSSGNIGGIIGYSNGTVNINNVTVANNNENEKLLIQSQNYKANIGAVIGQGNNVTIKNIILDTDGIQITSDNTINFAQNENYSGAVGGLFGLVNNLTFNINTTEVNVANIEFIFNKQSNYIGGIVGRVEDTLTLKTETQINNAFNIDNISGIKGVGYLGGFAGYVNKIQKVDNIALTLSGISVEETTDITDTNYLNLKANDLSKFDETYGNISGVFGYIKQNYDSSKAIRLANIELTSYSYFDSTSNSTQTIESEVIGKTSFIGGIIGRIDNYISLESLKNRAKITGNVYTNAYYVGGIAGYAGVSTLSKNSTINAVTNFAYVTGYDYVGGLFGKLVNSQLSQSTTSGAIIGSEINVTSGETAYTYYSNSRIGGLVGETNKVNLTDCHVTSGLSGKLSEIYGRNYVGGLVGAAIDSSVTYASITLNAIVAVGGQQGEYYKDENSNISASGGVFGYGLSNDSNNNITNVNVVVRNPNVNIKFGGVAGHLQNMEILEASTIVNYEENSNIRGIVYTIKNTGYNVNWYTENYWLLDLNSSSFIEQEGVEAEHYWNLRNGLNLAYAHNLKSAPSTNDYNETVVYSLYDEENSSISTLKMANGGKAVNANIKSVLNEDSSLNVIELVKQIYQEAGLWELTTKINDDEEEVNSLKFETSLDTRSIDLGYLNGTYTFTIAEGGYSYKDMYTAVNKRYLYNDSSINLEITINGTINDVECKDDAIMPIGTRLFPINNLTINGYAGAFEDKAILNIGTSNFKAGSSDFNKYNLYGLIGYVSGELSINDVAIKTLNDDNQEFAVQAIDDIHNYEKEYNEYFGVLVAMSSPTKVIPSYLAPDNIDHEINNVEINVEVVSSDANIVGGVIGIINVDTTVESYYDKNGSLVEDEEYKNEINAKNESIRTEIKRTITFSNVINKKDLFANSTEDDSIPTIVGGIIGYADASYYSSVANDDESYNYFEIVSNGVGNVDEDNKCVYYVGMKNEGDIQASDLAGGVFGYVGENIKISTTRAEVGTISDDISNDEENISGAIWNTGSVKAIDVDYSVAGGVIGTLKLGTNKNTDFVKDESIHDDWRYFYDLDNMYSGDFKYKIGYSYSYYSNLNTEDSLTASYVGGIIGQIQGDDSVDITKYVRIKNSHNYLNISHEISENTLVTDTIVGSGILGIFSDIKGLEFDNCINRGEVYSNSYSVGGFISLTTFALNEETDTNTRTYTTSYALDEERLSTKYDDSERNDKDQSIKELIFKSCINSSNNIGQLDTNIYVGGLVGKIENVLSITIESCQGEGYLTSATSEDSAVGGLVGEIELNDDYLYLLTDEEYSYNSRYAIENATMTGYYAGGLIGKLDLINDEYDSIYSYLKGNIKSLDGSNYEQRGFESSIQPLPEYSNNSTNYLKNRPAYESGKITILGQRFAGGILGYLKCDSDSVKLSLIFENFCNNTSIAYKKEILDTNNIDDGELQLYNGGILAGYNELNELYFNKCSNNAEINKNLYDYQPKSNIGGIISNVNCDESKVSYTEIINSTNSSYLYGLNSDEKNSYVGGLVGFVYYSTINISNCEVDGTIEGNSVGGFIGYAYLSTVKLGKDDSSSTNTFSGTASGQNISGGYIGLLQQSEADLYYASVTGRINSASEAGGLIGYNDISDVNIYNSKLSGAFVSGDCVGGVIGTASSGNITLSGITVGDDNGNTTIEGSSYMGGLFGSVEASVSLSSCTVNCVYFVATGVSETSYEVWMRDSEDSATSKLLRDLYYDKTQIYINSEADTENYTAYGDPYISEYYYVPVTQSDFQINVLNNGFENGFGMYAGNSKSIPSGLSVVLRSTLGDDYDDISTQKAEKVTKSEYSDNQTDIDNAIYSGKIEEIKLEYTDDTSSYKNASSINNFDFDSYSSLYDIKTYTKLKLENGQYVIDETTYKYANVSN